MTCGACGGKFPLGIPHECPTQEERDAAAIAREEVRLQRVAARGTKPAGTKGRATIGGDDRQDINVARRSLQRAYELLEAPVGPEARRDAVAHVRLASSALNDLLTREARRTR